MPTPALRRLIVVAAGLACVVLALVVLIAHPLNEDDVLAGGVLAAGAGLLALLL